MFLGEAPPGGYSATDILIPRCSLLEAFQPEHFEALKLELSASSTDELTARSSSQTF
jgi:hypothetical protein